MSGVQANQQQQQQQERKTRRSASLSFRFSSTSFRRSKRGRVVTIQNSCERNLIIHQQRNAHGKMSPQTRRMNQSLTKEEEEESVERSISSSRRLVFEESRRGSMRRLRSIVAAASHCFWWSQRQLITTTMTTLTTTETVDSTVHTSSDHTDREEEEEEEELAVAIVVKPFGSQKVRFYLPQQQQQETTEGKSSHFTLDESTQSEFWYTPEDFRRQRVQDRKMVLCRTNASVQNYVEAFTRLVHDKVVVDHVVANNNNNKQRKIICALCPGLHQGYRGLEVNAPQLAHRREHAKRVVQAVTLASKIVLVANEQKDGHDDRWEKLANLSRRMTGLSRDTALSIGKADAMASNACAMD